MLYLSSKSAMDGSKAVRGGIPICFPNFGPWKFGAQHGFARTSNSWRVQHPPQVDEDTGDVKVTLSSAVKMQKYSVRCHFICV